MLLSASSTRKVLEQCVFLLVLLNNIINSHFVFGTQEHIEPWNAVYQSSTQVLEHCVFWYAPVGMLYNTYFCLHWSDTVIVHISSTVSGGKFTPLAYFSMDSIGIYTCLFSR